MQDNSLLLPAFYRLRAPGKLILFLNLRLIFLPNINFFLYNKKWALFNLEKNAHNVLTYYAQWQQLYAAE